MSRRSGRAANEPGDRCFDLYAIERTHKLFEILQELERDPFLGGQLAHYGGTALNAFHLDIPRLSMDIDIKLMDLAGGDAAAGQGIAAERIEGILRGLGLDIKHRKRSDWGGRWESSFISAHGGISGLHIDVGWTGGGPLFDLVLMDSRELAGRKARNIPTLDIRDIIAGKLAALVQRCKARDMFDAANIDRIIDGLAEDDRRDIRAAYIAQVAGSRDGGAHLRILDPGRDPHEACQQFMLNMPVSFRSKAVAVSWYQKSLAMVQERFGHLTRFTPNETAFIAGIRDRGNIDAGLLDASAELRERIARWTPLLMRCEIARNRDGSGR